MKLRNSPENLEKRRIQEPAASSMDRAACQAAELERKRMDWLLGLLIPVKWALVLIAVYFLITLIL